MIGEGSTDPKGFKGASASSDAGPGEAAAAAAASGKSVQQQEDEQKAEEGCSNNNTKNEDGSTAAANVTKHPGDESSTTVQSTRRQSDETTAINDTPTNNSNNEPNVHQGRIHLPPGAYHVHGFNTHEDNNATREQRDAANNNNVSSTGDDIDDDDGMVFEGFVPEPTPQERARELLRNAITLDESAVRPIIDDDSCSPTGIIPDHQKRSTAKDDAERGSFKIMCRSPMAFLIFTLIILSAIALGVSLGSSDNSNTASLEEPLGSDDNGSGTTLPSTSSSCSESKFQERYNVAKAIASSITSLETLDDTTSPQSRALDWIACRDEISSTLIDERDAVTGVLPRQANGFKHGGDSGESQVLRRYALAVFFFSTSERGPWTEEWNFLSPNLHECSWHENKTRSNFPYGDYDYPGLVCAYEDPRQEHIVLDDAEYEIHEADLNLRIPNNIVGTLPPELGYLRDITWVELENQKGLHGSLPGTIGNMNLKSFSILFGGQEFGGVIPSSLFTIPSIQYVTFIQNEGVWEFPTSIASPAEEAVLSDLNFGSTGLSGAIPSCLTELTSLKKIDFAGNSLEGTIPDLGKLSTLEFISFYDNDLSGTLPESLGRMTNLKVMSFGRNNFQGTLPQSLGRLNKLQVLDLSYSRLEGTIPNGFTNLTSLEHISLQHNGNLRGSIAAFEPLQSLSTLLLYGNSFSSTIPSNLFFNSSRQIFVDFGHNNFTGKLPETFSRYATNTSYLAIMGNDFDEDAVDGKICNETRILHADCRSCPCCDEYYCCTGDTVDEDSPYCSFDLDFYKLTGLECGTWWEFCHDAYYDPLPLD